MKNISARKLKNLEKGFTLIELLVVIGILAILLAITLIAINPSRQFAQARDTSRRNSATQILNAIGGYFADNGGILPPGISTAATAVRLGISSADAPGLCEALTPNYMPAIARDPSMNLADITASANTCPSGWDTGFFFIKSSTGRITVSATGEITASINVTR